MTEAALLVQYYLQNPPDLYPMGQSVNLSRDMMTKGAFDPLNRHNDLMEWGPSKWVAVYALTAKVCGIK